MLTHTTTTRKNISSSRGNDVKCLHPHIARLPVPDQSGIEIVGYVAGAITTLSFLPQLILTVRSGEADGVSLRMYLLFSCGVALWITYGAFRKSPAVVLTNAVTLLLTVVIVGLVARTRLKGKQQANSLE